MALLGKWCWRLLVEKESLWYRVLLARYGEEGGRLLDGGRTTSAWWRTIAALRKEAWCSTHVSRSVGYGKHFIFGRICGWVGCPLGKGLADCLSCRWINGCRCLICFSWVGVRMVRLGSGGGVYLRGNKSKWGNYVYYFKM